MGIAAASGFHFEQVNSMSPQTPPLLILHGSGGSELSLMDFAHSIAPDRTAFHLCGGVPWESRCSFFWRDPDRTLDHNDLDRWPSKLCGFLAYLDAEGYGKPWLVGYSNGSIMAAATVLKAPTLSSGAILRPLSPRADDDVPPLPRYPVLAAPTSDGTRPTRQTSRSSSAVLELQSPSTSCKRGLRKATSTAISYECGWPSAAPCRYRFYPS
jgi:phospholipase/carboxylesterase